MDYTFEHQAHEQGFEIVCGVDEAGRGPLAGPVVAGAVILPKGCSYEWRCTHSGHFSIIEFESELICNDIFSFSVKSSEKILKLFKELEYKRTLRKPMYEPESIRDTYSILLMLIQSVQKKYLPIRF